MERIVQSREIVFVKLERLENVSVSMKISNERERLNKQEREKIIKSVKFLGRCEGTGYEAQWEEMRKCKGGKERIRANVNEYVHVMVGSGGVDEVRHAKHVA